MRWIRDGLIVAATFVICVAPVRAQDDHLRRQLQALGAITSTADSICYTVKQEGHTDQGTLSGPAKAKVNNAISALGDLRFEGAATLTTLDYQGVERDALPAVLGDSQACKRAVFDRLVVIMVPSVQDTGLPIKKSVHLNPRRPEHRPSINCSKITEPLEELLCADDDLAQWDGRMGQRYWQRMQQLTPVRAQRLKQRQLDWIVLRNMTCSYDPLESHTLDELAPAKPCILQMTKQRALDLSN
jgi:uncharacterized protein YecT (DUF1311 family)